MERSLPVNVNSRTDRLMARIALVIFCGGLIYGFYSLGGPVYWKFYATVIHPFEDHSPPISQTKAVAPEIAAPKESPPPPSPSPPPPSPVEKPFNVDDYPLTRERVHALLQDGMIMITWANHHYLDFAKTWVFHMKQLGITGYMVGAMDDDMLKDLALLKINTWRMNTGIVKHDLGWGSQNFHKMGRAKIQLIQSFMAFDVTVVISDIDTAWVKNPLPYFQRYPNADILTSTDQLGPTVQTDELERFPEAGSSFNIGIMLFRPKSKEFVDAWVKSLENPQMWDQTAFNDLARMGHGSSDPANKNLFKGYNGKLVMGVLPSALFCSGHTYFVQRKYREYGLEPYVAHATFQYSGTPGKRNRFREAMLFDDPPSYYDDPKGFIYIQMDLPQELMLKAAEPVNGEMTPAKLYLHFQLVHHQLFQLRAALAVAYITRRIIILPPIWCQLDKYWAPLWDGNIPGSHWKKPFICPADHVLDLEGGWAHQRDEVHWGPNIEWREYSFLENFRMPASVNNSRVVIDVCKTEDEPGCADTPLLQVLNAKDAVLKLKPNRMASQLQGLPGPSLAKILVFKNIMHLFKGFDTPQDQEKWERRLNHYTSVICCLSTNPGWVWYDFFADRPHKDRFGREFNGTWVAKRGDTNTDAVRRNLLAQLALAPGADAQAQAGLLEGSTQEPGVVVVGGRGRQLLLPGAREQGREQQEERGAAGLAPWLDAQRYTSDLIAEWKEEAML